MNEKNAYRKENKNQLTLFGVIAAALFVILAGIFAWEVPVVWACVMILLEAGLSACMHNVPIWIHIMIVIAQIVVGAIFGAGIFLLLCAVFYIIGILALSIWNH